MLWLCLRSKQSHYDSISLCVAQESRMFNTKPIMWILLFGISSGNMQPLQSRTFLTCLILAIHLCYPIVGWTSPISTATFKPDSLRTTSTTTCFASFDFSSQSEWDRFYKQEKENNQETVEWHSSIPLEVIASFVPQGSKCLIPGCGNSKLPKVILSSVKDVRLVLQDSSKTCLDQLQATYGTSARYYCGDATTSLTNLCKENNDKFDLIVDKGLVDAILCGEGWNGPLERLMKEASNCLDQENGRYLMISYKLPTSTKEFLKHVGNEVGFEWTFDIPEYSNQRVGVSLARKIKIKK